MGKGISDNPILNPNRQVTINTFNIRGNKPITKGGK